MRRKSDDRREAIIAIAIRLFCERGYSHTTMSLIASRVGGSKGTLYGYFRSKEELFDACVTKVITQWDLLEKTLENQDLDIGSSLRNFGHSYLTLAALPEALMVRRTILTQGWEITCNPSHFFAPVLMILSTYLDRHRATRLSSADPMDAANDFIALLDGSYIEPLMWRIDQQPDLDKAVDFAVAIFLRAHSEVSSNP